MPVTTRPYFFVHVMKTAGTTMYGHARVNFPGRLYPSPVPGEDDMFPAYTSLPYLLGLSEERRATIDAYFGHFPFVATDLMEIDLVTMSLLRDPVERTVSFLRQNKTHLPEHRDLSLEEIYDDAFHYPAFIRNHQTKVFSMAVGDVPLVSAMDFVDIDDARLARAKENLERLDVLGLSERTPEFLSVLEDRYEWKITPIKRFRESTDAWTADAALRRRIERDNAYDVELYEHARELCRGGVAVRG